MVGAEKVAQQSGNPRVQIASKTGTAEHGTDLRHTPPHAWYIAFAPAQAPKVAAAGGERPIGCPPPEGFAAPIGRKTKPHCREPRALSCGRCRQIPPAAPHATGGMGQVWRPWITGWAGVLREGVKSEFSSDPEFIERFRGRSAHYRDAEPSGHRQRNITVKAG